MSPVIVALLFGLGVGAWVYNKVYRRMGGITQNVLVVSGIAAVFAFFFFWMVMNTLGGWLE